MNNILNNICLLATWVFMIVAAFQLIATNLTNLHIKQDGSKENTLPFPHIWFALFLFCLLMLFAHYDFGL